MRSRLIPSVGVPIFVLTLLFCSLVPLAWAQTEVGAGVSGGSSEVERSGAAWLDDGVLVILLSEGVVLLVCALGCGGVVAAMEAFERRRERREEKAAQLHGRITTALRRDRLLKNLAVTPIVHLPLWGWSGATIELRGHVPTAWLRHALLIVAEREAARCMAVYYIQDRMTIAPSMEALAG
jgi:hypothetical protein